MSAPLSLLCGAVVAVRVANPNLDSNASAVLNRLLADPRAAEAVAAMTNDPATACRIVRASLECDLICRRFYEDVTAEKMMPKRLDSLSDAVTDLDRFVRELDAGPQHQLAAYVALEPGEADYLRQALGRIRGLIDGRRRIATETPPRLGATQKWKTNGAGETAALGWIAEAIKSATGQPHYAQTATLADIILQAGDAISDDRVREALRTRRGKDWRM